ATVNESSLWVKKAAGINRTSSGPGEVGWEAAVQFEKKILGMFLDIFEAEFLPHHIPSARLQSPALVALTTKLYKDRCFDQMAALATKLKEAGCDDREIIRHCESSGPHVRGCWVLDSLLGKQ